MIHKVTTSWIKSVVGITLTTSFSDAWSNIINALNGAWGDINYNPIKGNPDITMNVTVMKSMFEGSIDTEIEGPVDVIFPYSLTDYGFITVKEVLGNDVTNITTYIQDYTGSTSPEELTIILPSGRKIITVSGTARRT